MLLDSKAAYSRDQTAFKSMCGVAKHSRCLQVARVARKGAAALQCRVCARKGSGHEQVAYACLDAEPLIKHYAVETYALAGEQFVTRSDGTTCRVRDHRWDALTLSPPGLLIEVHGEQHTSKLDARARNGHSDMRTRQELDRLLGEAARAAGFSVLWLYADASLSQVQLRARWAEKLRQAAAHAQAGGAPALFAA